MAFFNIKYISSELKDYAKQKILIA